MQGVRQNHQRVNRTLKRKRLTTYVRKIASKMGQYYEWQARQCCFYDHSFRMLGKENED